MKSLSDAVLMSLNSCNLPRNQLWYNLQLKLWVLQVPCSTDTIKLSKSTVIYSVISEKYILCLKLTLALYFQNHSTNYL